MKWKELGYEHCSWEVESDISAFQPQIEKFKVIQSRRRKRFLGKTKDLKHNSNRDSKDSRHNSNRDSKDLKNKQKEFQPYDQTPEFLSGGMHSFI